MKYKISFSSYAKLGILNLYDYIAEKSNTERASGYIRRLEAYCRTFSTFPGRGTQRDNLRAGLRTAGFERRVTIAFQIEEETAIIDRILYGDRSLEKAFGDEEV